MAAAADVLQELYHEIKTVDDSYIERKEISMTLVEESIEFLFNLLQVKITKEEEYLQRACQCLNSMKRLFYILLAFCHEESAGNVVFVRKRKNPSSASSSVDEERKRDCNILVLECLECVHNCVFDLVASPDEESAVMGVCGWKRLRSGLAPRVCSDKMKEHGKRKRSGRYVSSAGDSVVTSSDEEFAANGVCGGNDLRSGLAPRVRKDTMNRYGKRKRAGRITSSASTSVQLVSILQFEDGSENQEMGLVRRSSLHYSRFNALVS